MRYIPPERLRFHNWRITKKYKVRRKMHLPPKRASRHISPRVKLQTKIPKKRLPFFQNLLRKYDAKISERKQIGSHVVCMILCREHNKQKVKNVLANHKVRTKEVRYFF